MLTSLFSSLHHNLGLSRYDTAVWLLIIGAQLSLAVILIIRKARHESNSYPSFELFSYFVAVQNVVWLIIGAGFGLKVYIATYYSLSYIATALMALVIPEIYLKVIGPRIAVPTGTLRKFLISVAVAFPLCVAANAFWRSKSMWAYLNILSTVDRIMMSVICLTLWFLIVHAKTLRVSWSKTIAGITAGFVLFLTVDVVTSFIVGRTRGQAALIARMIEQCSYLGALAIWNSHMLLKDPVPQK